MVVRAVFRNRLVLQKFRPLALLSRQNIASFAPHFISWQRIRLLKLLTLHWGHNLAPLFPNLPSVLYARTTHLWSKVMKGLGLDGWRGTGR